MVESAQPNAANSSGHLQHYTPVLWRSASPVRETGWCVSFVTEGGEVIRLRLPTADAANLVEVGYRNLIEAGCALQLETSPLNLVIDELPQDSGVKGATNA